MPLEIGTGGSIPNPPSAPSGGGGGNPFQAAQAAIANAQQAAADAQRRAEEARRQAQEARQQTAREQANSRRVEIEAQRDEGRSRSRRDRDGGTAPVDGGDTAQYAYIPDGSDDDDDRPAPAGQAQDVMAAPEGPNVEEWQRRFFEQANLPEPEPVVAEADFTSPETWDRFNQQQRFVADAPTTAQQSDAYRQFMRQAESAGPQPAPAPDTGPYDIYLPGMNTPRPANNQPAEPGYFEQVQNILSQTFQPENLQRQFSAWAPWNTYNPTPMQPETTSPPPAAVLPPAQAAAAMSRPPVDIPADRPAYNFAPAADYFPAPQGQQVGLPASISQAPEVTVPTASTSPTTTSIPADAVTTPPTTASAEAGYYGEDSGYEYDPENVPIGDDDLYAPNPYHSRYAKDIDWVNDYGFASQAQGDRWAEQFADEHGDALPWDSERQGSDMDPLRLLNEHVAALRWGGQFQSDFGRRPEESEYQMEWYRGRFGDPNRELTWRPDYDLKSNRFVPQPYFGLDWSNLSNKHWEPFGPVRGGQVYPRGGGGGYPSNGGGGQDWRAAATNRWSNPPLAGGI